ncbi:MAG: hypothetical protein HY231_26725 [Acidobacteria bacterium]|nr:hypothetical protein [Acidobacteriota bacterium]
MAKTVRVELKDGLGFPSGFVSPASYTCVMYYRVPESWVNGDKLFDEKREAMLENMYGNNWRMGNEDGSYYVVFSYAERVLAADEEVAHEWLQHGANDTACKYWYYQVAEDGSFTDVKAQDF